MQEPTTPAELQPGLSETFHTRFRKARLEAGYSLKAVGTAAGVSFQAVRNFEAGKQNLKLQGFVAACELLNVNVRWVLKGLGSMFESGQLPTPDKGRKRRPAHRAGVASEVGAIPEQGS